VKRYFYILCALPGLKTFRDPPPVGKQKLLSLVTESGGPSDIVRALLLYDDLIQREAVLAGEIEPFHTDPAVLTSRQAKADKPLPEFLISEYEFESETPAKLIATDPIWRNYFHHVSEIAKINHSDFLQDWVEFEVGLRNALAKIRAVALKLDPKPYMVAPELENSGISFENILADWTGASNPLKATEVLDRARWNRLTKYEQWYNFSSDEIGAYTAKLMILHRWRRIIGKGHI